MAIEPGSNLIGTYAQTVGPLPTSVGQMAAQRLGLGVVDLCGTARRAARIAARISALRRVTPRINDDIDAETGGGLTAMAIMCER